MIPYRWLGLTALRTLNPAVGPTAPLQAGMHKLKAGTTVGTQPHTATPVRPELRLLETAADSLHSCPSQMKQHPHTLLPSQEDRTPLSPALHQQTQLPLQKQLDHPIMMQLMT